MLGSEQPCCTEFGDPELVGIDRWTGLQPICTPLAPLPSTACDRSLLLDAGACEALRHQRAAAGAIATSQIAVPSRFSPKALAASMG
jgi:hypothetical protein